MNYSAVKKVKAQLLLGKNALVNALLIEGYSPDLSGNLGYNEWLIAETDNIIRNYDYIKNYIDMHYFGDEPLDEAHDLKDLVLSCLGATGGNMLYIKESLDPLFISYVRSYHHMERRYSEGFDNLFKSVPRYKQTEDGTLIQMTDDEINLVNLENDIKNQILSESINDWKPWHKNLVSLASEENYGKLLDEIFN